MAREQLYRSPSTPHADPQRSLAATRRRFWLCLAASDAQYPSTNAQRNSAPGLGAPQPIAKRMNVEDRRFVTAADAVRFLSPWTLEEWLCRADIVPNEHLLLVRANMEAGRSHPFHTHPTREEIIFIISGRAEQWCGRQHRILTPGEMVFIPKGEVHGTYNPFDEKLVFLAMLSPAKAAEPAVVDVSAEEPWKSMRAGFPSTL